MEAHHQRAIDGFLARYRDGEGVEAILLVGSLAHGFARADSDVDIIIVLGEAEYAGRKRENALAFSLWDICDYEGGYVDCKVTSRSAMRAVAERGSDPARYAYKDAVVLFSRDGSARDMIADVTRFPKHDKAERQRRFACQLLAWKWYMSQAEQKRNAYLTHLACQKIALFASRIVLNHNEMLYPYHKWLLAETMKAPEKPDGFDCLIAAFVENPTYARADTIVNETLRYIGISEKSADWPNQFMIDSEMTWLDHESPIDDL